MSRASAGTPLAGAELDDVARHEVLRVDDPQSRRRARPRPRSTSSRSSASIARRARSSVTNPMSGVDDEHRADRDGFEEIPERQRDTGRGNQQEHDDARELIEQDFSADTRAGGARRFGPKCASRALPRRLTSQRCASGPHRARPLQRARANSPAHVAPSTSILSLVAAMLQAIGRSRTRSPKPRASRCRRSDANRAPVARSAAHR